MDTARMRALRMFPQASLLLTDLVKERRLIPADAQLIHLEGLPAALAGRIARAERKREAWRAWSSQRETFAIVAALDEASARVYARPVLSVLLYDTQGRVIGTSKWLEKQPGEWTSCDG